MRSIFNLDNPVFRALSLVGDVLILSLWWLLTSLPVFTIGASTTAAFSAAMKLVRKRGTSITKDYFSAFRSNFRQATVIFLIFAAVAALFSVDIYFWANNGSEYAFLGGAVSIAVMLPVAATLMFVFPVQAIFDNKIKDTIRTAFFISLKDWSTSILLLLIGFGVSFLCYVFPLAVLLFLVFGTGGLALGLSMRYLVIFAKYSDVLAEDIAALHVLKEQETENADTQARAAKQEASRGRVIR